MPDATGLELLAQELRDARRRRRRSTPCFFRDQATLDRRPRRGPRGARRTCASKGFDFLASVHGVDYYPEEPRLGVHYELLDMSAVDRITVKAARARSTPRTSPSVDADWPTADHQEREVYDMFGVIFDGHPDLRRILMPEDYEGHPQRRDFPIGGEPVLFTHNEDQVPEVVGVSTPTPRRAADRLPPGARRRIDARRHVEPALAPDAGRRSC